MNLRELEIFCALMRCRTTIAAAHELNISQPAVSNAMKHLSDQLGVRLFERIGNRLIPTVEAKALYRDAEPLHAMAAAVGHKARELRDMKSGHLRIYSSHALSRTIVAEGLRRFLQNRGRIQVFFDVRRMEGVIESVESGLVDLGVVLSPAPRPGMEIAPLIKGRLVVICPPGHPLAAKNDIGSADLEQERIIGLESVSQIGRLVRASFDGEDAKYQPMIEVRHCVTACALVEKGMGVAIVDEFSAGPSGHWKLEVRPFAPAVSVVASALYLSNRPLSRVASRFVEELRALPWPLPQ